MRSKLNRNYLSPYEEIATIGLRLDIPFFGKQPLLPYSWIASFDQKYYGYERDLSKLYADMGLNHRRRLITDRSERTRNTRLGTYIGLFAGGFQPLLDIEKELKDSVTRYKSVYGRRSHLTQDLLLPVRAVGNVLAGCMTFVAAFPLALVRLLNMQVGFCRHLAKSGLRYATKKLCKNALYVGVSTLAHWVNGLGRVGLGVLQAVKTCLLPVILVTRLGHTIVRGKPKAKDDQGFKEAWDDLIKIKNNDSELMSNGEVPKSATLTSTVCLMRLGKKVDKFKAQGRKLDYTDIESNSNFNGALEAFFKESQAENFSKFFETYPLQKRIESDKPMAYHI